MSVAFNIKCSSVEEMHVLRDRICLSLVGSPAFINNEIAVCDLQDDAFTLFVGDYNKENEERNVEYDIHSSQLLER